MQWISKIRSFTITAESEKEAYIKGCKSIAKYIANPKYKNLVTKIERANESNTFIFTIFSNIDVGEEQKKFCKVCSETHKLFYCNDSKNCDYCTFKSFMNRVSEKCNVQKGFYKGRIE